MSAQLENAVEREGCLLSGLMIFGVTLFLAYANGANDNFKGVATILGSHTTDYRKALFWAAATTFAGSIAAFFLAARLVQTFSGKGLVPDAAASSPAFLTAVILGAGLTVFSTAKFGIPISTTHALTGALVGAGFVAFEGNLGFASLGKNFFLPLLLSPFIAFALTSAVYPVFRWARLVLGVNKQTCICVGERFIPAGSLALNTGGIISQGPGRSVDVFIRDKAFCETAAVELYQGRVFGLDAQKALNFSHFVSAGAVGFSRGLNDTPKIAALSVAGSALGLGLGWNIVLISIAMAAGGLLSARKVAQTMSHRITQMNHGQGFTANLITSFLVIFASRWGLPVSTTHVSCGALFGIGLVNGRARWKTIGGIFSAWALTLPLAAALAAAAYWISNPFLGRAW